MTIRLLAPALALSLAGMAAVGCTSGGSTPEPTPSPSSPASTATTSGPPATNAPTIPPAPKVYRSPPATLPTGPVTLSTQPPPWVPPAVVDGGAESADYVAAAGLPYAEEMLRVHYHAHLDITVDGDVVEVPPYLGFVTQGDKALGLAPLHTHDNSGVIHIENDVPARFVLGQVFVEWGVRFTDKCLGSSCSGNGKELAVFVNGKRYAGDPTRLVLASHQEIAVEYGDTGSLPTPPSSYDFPAGD